MNSTLSPLGRFLFRTRNYLFPIIWIVLLFAFDPLGWSPVWGLVAVNHLGGAALVMAGVLLRAAVIGFEYIRRGGKDGQVFANDLVTGGLFAACRNPLYVGNLLILVGLLVVFGNPWAMLCGTLVWGLSYRAIVAAEENYLMEEFGAQYADYCAQTPRWRLRIKAIKPALAGMRFNWARVVIKDYGTIYLALSGVLLLLVYAHLFQLGRWVLDGQALSMVLLMVVCTGLYGIARFLKKTRRLKRMAAAAGV